MLLSILVISIGVCLVVGSGIKILVSRPTSQSTPSDSEESLKTTSKATPENPPLQKYLGPYELLSILGKGGMATVYKARQKGNSSIVALKVISPEHQDNQEFYQRFLREVQLAQQLKHTNFVEFYQVQEIQGQICLIMECVDGKTLDLVLTRGPVPFHLFFKLSNQLLEGLHYAHTQHLVHRDIKPGNIMITRDSRIKILDFGLAIAEGQTRFTSLGFSMGTPSHMAPEMLTQGISNQQTDQYALGIVFYQMLTGMLPFHSKHPMELGMMHVQNPVPPIATLRPDTPLAWQELTLKMLAKNAGERFINLAEIQKKLLEATS